MEITTSKMAALAIALCNAIAIVGFTTHPASVVLLLGPLALIWFPEELGSYTGYVSRGSTIDTETPPFIVSGLGWLFLVLMGITVTAISLGYK